VGLAGNHAYTAQHELQPLWYCGTLSSPHAVMKHREMYCIKIHDSEPEQPVCRPTILPEPCSYLNVELSRHLIRERRWLCVVRSCTPRGAACTALAPARHTGGNHHGWSVGNGQRVTAEFRHEEAYKRSSVPVLKLIADQRQLRHCW
jgi:hypothetical protein